MKKILVIIIAFSYSITSPKSSLAQSSSYKVENTGISYDFVTFKDIKKAGEEFDASVNKLLKEMAPLKPIGYSVIIQENELGLSVTYKTTLVECTPEEAIDTLIRIGYYSDEPAPNSDETEEIPAIKERKEKVKKVYSALKKKKFIIIIDEEIETEITPKLWPNVVMHVSTSFITAKNEN